MKIYTLIIAYLLSMSSLYAIPGEVDPEFADSSATFAKHKARLRAFGTDDFHSYDLFDDAGCNINVGNVILDDGFQDAPDEVVVIVEGDIIQANNCR